MHQPSFISQFYFFSSDKGPTEYSGDDKCDTGLAHLSLRNSFKMCVYTLFSAAWVAEEVYSSAKQNELLDPTNKGKEKEKEGRKAKKIAGTNDTKFSWGSTRIDVFNTMVSASRVNRSKLWHLGVPDEAFVHLFTRLAYKALELPTTVKTRTAAGKDIKAAVFSLIIEHYCSLDSIWTPVTAAVLQLITNYEHLPVPMAELCGEMSRRMGGSTRLAGDLLREICRLDLRELSRNAAGVRNVSTFLTELASVQPHSILANMSILMTLFELEPYPLRSALCGCIGAVLEAAHQTRLSEEDGISKDQQNDNGTCVWLDKKKRDQLMDLILKRELDVSSYTRSAVIRCWHGLIEKHAVPLDHIVLVAKLGTSRLFDKSSLVRKAALQLLEGLLGNNPCSGNLNPLPFEEEAKRITMELDALPADEAEVCPTSPKRSEVEEALEELEKRGGPDEGSDSEISTGSQVEGKIEDSPFCGEGGLVEEVDCEAFEQKCCTTSEPPLKSEEQLDELGLTPCNQSRNKLLHQLFFCRSALQFISIYEDAIPQICSMLGSRMSSDVIEAINFFVVANAFDLPSAKNGTKKSLSLVWHSDVAIRDAASKSFTQTFITGTQEGAASFSPSQVAMNLMSLVNKDSFTELTCLEEVVGRLTVEGVITSTAYDHLWHAVSKGDDYERMSALMVISMGAKANSALVGSPDRMKCLLECGLGKHTQKCHDWPTVMATCRVLQQCSLPAGADSSEAPIFDACILKLVHFLQGQWSVPLNNYSTIEEIRNADAEMQHWFAAAEQAISVIFKLSSQPEVTCSCIVKSMASDTIGIGLPTEHQPEEPLQGCSSLALARLCFVLGDVALKLLVYSEELFARLKLARNAKTSPPQKGLNDRETSGGKDIEGEGMTENEYRTDDSTEDDAMENELGMCAEEEAAEEEQFKEICEVEIVKRNLLGLFGPLLGYIVVDTEKHFTHPLLQESALLALSKYMCVSSTFCEEHLDVIFTSLDRAQSPSQCANIVIALGDLAFRFPNAVEPWSHLIYARLHDSDSGVRASVIMVLTHLILNDMVKVKGFISEIALCIQDEEEHIRRLVKVFFHELSKRSQSPIYNLLPDIVGRLSHNEKLSQESFKQIMSFLLSFVRKDKQTEGLVEKLVSRIVAAETQRQRQDMSYCLGQLQITEKCVRRLAELLPSYKEALEDPVVYDNFLVLVSNARKFAKPEMKEAVQDWERLLSELHEGGANALSAALRAKTASRRANSRSNKISSASSSKVNAKNGGGKRGSSSMDRKSIRNAKPNQCKVRKSKRYVESSDSESEQLDSDALSSNDGDKEN